MRGGVLSVKTRKRQDPSEFIAQRLDRRPSSIEQLGKGLPLPQDRAGKPFKYYCPFCQVQHTLQQSAPKPTLKHHFQIALTTAVLMLILWPWTHLKGVVFFVPIWAIFELVFRTRTRAALVCVNCGFDPTLYLVDASKARTEVEVFWRKKFADRGLAYPSDEVESEEMPPPAVRAPARPSAAADSP